MAVTDDSAVLDLRDQRLIAALQCDGRLSIERAAEVLGISPVVVGRRWKALLDSGTIRVTVVPANEPAVTTVLLRIKVLRDRADAVAQTLADRDDIAFVDLCAGGDEISAVLITTAGTPLKLLFRQLPATGVVTGVDANTVLHLFKHAHQWRHHVLTPQEEQALTPAPAPGRENAPLDATDRAVLNALADYGRAPAAAIARTTRSSESTVRRRLAALRARGQLVTHVHVAPGRLGLGVDANLLLHVPPSQLDAVGQQLAAHPAVHGAAATTGRANLYIAVWLPGLPDLYTFLSDRIGATPADSAETVLITQTVKRPGYRRPPLRPAVSNAAPRDRRPTAR